MGMQQLFTGNAAAGFLIAWRACYAILVVHGKLSCMKIMLHAVRLHFVLCMNYANTAR